MPLGNTVTYACDATNGNVIDGSALTATFDTENRPRTIARSESGSDGDGGTDLIFKSSRALFDSSAHDRAPRKIDANKFERQVWDRVGVAVNDF